MGDDRVFLNIYELPMSAPNVDQSSRYAGVASFFSRILPSAGFGAYHTSLDVGRWTYAYAVGGITKTPVAHKHRDLPPQAQFLESLPLGTVAAAATESSADVARKVQRCLDHLRAHSFGPDGYHLACRNCNHFTQTLATALVSSGADLAAGRALRLYPNYVNRLARAGSSGLSVLDPGAGGAEGMPAPCDVMKEARAARGVDDVQTTKADKQKRKEKKELTEAQKQMLAKMKGPKK